VHRRSSCFLTFSFFTVMYGTLTSVYPGEVFPTEIRGIGTGFAAAVSRIGAAPRVPLAIRSVLCHTLSYMEEVEWDEEAADHIRSRSRRYPGGTARPPRGAARGVGVEDPWRAAAPVPGGTIG
jgi:hypothetical protein